MIFGYKNHVSRWRTHEHNRVVVTETISRLILSTSLSEVMLSPTIIRKFYSTFGVAFAVVWLVCWFNNIIKVHSDFVSLLSTRNASRYGFFSELCDVVHSFIITI